MVFLVFHLGYMSGFQGTRSSEGDLESPGKCNSELYRDVGLLRVLEQLVTQRMEDRGRLSGCP